MEQKMVPYFMHEGELARQERTIRRLWITCLVGFISLVVSNIVWLSTLV